ncbi:Endoglucanase H precursor [Actinomadura rubteroloni]|uniref:Endoglucanase H n=1 Tax=Actinomadura rubteroloni TaxID=1926885 RepID=A0A2P4UQ00_9ACTN|nr:glycosyl hydrolase [Actinomadura rubteroloni]POM27123.1 Endoglucanase H precursor [Actinomadura rubteroloni]
MLDSSGRSPHSRETRRRARRRARRLAEIALGCAAIAGGLVVALDARSEPAAVQSVDDTWPVGATDDVTPAVSPTTAPTTARPTVTPSARAADGDRKTVRTARRTVRRTAKPGLRAQDDCAQRADLVPGCGTWWGVSPGVDSLATLESEVGRSFDIVHFWYGVDQVNVPSPPARQLAAQGRILHVNIASRPFGGSGDARWADVAAGRWDASLARQAQGIAGLRTPVFVTFDHEPDAKPKINSRGTPEDYVRAWRHVHDVYTRYGATNAVWTWVLTGYAGNLPRAARFYPGNSYVDWIGWENYLGTLCDGRTWEDRRFRTFEETFLPFYNWLKGDGARAGIDPDKPYMLNGMASVRFEDPNLSVRWYAQIPRALSRYPQIKAVQLWQPPKGMACPYRLMDRPLEVVAFAHAGQAPYVNPDELDG